MGETGLRWLVQTAEADLSLAMKWNWRIDNGIAAFRLSLGSAERVVRGKSLAKFA